MLEKHFEFVRKTLFDNKVPFHDEKKDASRLPSVFY